MAAFKQNSPMGLVRGRRNVREGVRELLELGKNSDMDTQSETGVKKKKGKPSLKSQQEILILPHTNPNINARRKINMDSHISQHSELSFFIQFSN